MATIYSDGFTKVRAGRNLNSNEWGGKARILMWDFASLPAGNIGDVLVCGKIRKDERVLFGIEFHSAHTGASGSYGTYAVLSDGISLGAADSAARFLAATSFNAAGQNNIAATQSLTIGTGVLFPAPSDLFLVCVNSVAAFTTAGRISGWVLLLGD
jgi:hypothetical protein